MGSSNRHWPSMFKSKPCNTTHHQWQNDQLNSSLISSVNCHRTPYTPGSGYEERTPEPKPRWNPRPEQIRILEAIFNSGMVNPPRDEIRKISVQLQEYGQVGDANVFYWFQNRKSRSKHKLRQLQNSTNKPTNKQAKSSSSSSSSSSSDKSSPNNSNEKVILSTTGIHHDLLNSPTASVNQQPFLQASTDFLTPFFFPVQQNGTVGSISGNLTQGFCFPDETSHVTDQSVGNCPSFLLSELMLMSSNCNTKKDEDEKMKLQENLSYSSLITAPINAQPIVPPSVSVQSPTNYINQDVGEQVGTRKTTVFINDVCFEVGVGPFNVKEAFGDDAMLIQSTGHPVLTNYWGFTLEPLRHGAFYYLVRAFSPSPDERTTIDLI